MKVTKNYKVRLQHGDYRVANFVFHTEKEHIKVQDINNLSSWRIHNNTAVAYLVKEAIDNKNDNFLHMYAASVFSQLCIVPDLPFFRKHAELLNQQTQQHPEYYGKTQDNNDEKEDGNIIDEERALYDETQHFNNT